jgi:hypothetical protein
MSHRVGLSSLAVLVLSGFDPLGALDEEEQFAVVLHQILRASREHFRPVEGARIDVYPGRRSYFQARVDLPGTTECRIDETPLLVYSCKWKPAGPAPGTTPAALCQKLVTRVEAALGSEWQRVESRQPQTKASFQHQGRYRQTEVKVSPPPDRSGGCAISISVRRSKP